MEVCAVLLSVRWTNNYNRSVDLADRPCISADGLVGLGSLTPSTTGPGFSLRHAQRAIGPLTLIVAGVAVALAPVLVIHSSSRSTYDARPRK